MTAASSGKVTSSRTGLVLDPADPEDAKILARQRKVARETGRRGGGRPGPDRPDLQQAYDEGAKSVADQAQPTKAPAGKGGGKPSAWTRFRQMGPGWQSVKPTSPARVPTRVGDGGGFAAGLLLYTVTVIYIRYGPQGFKGWLKAKFLNQPMDPAGPTKGHGSKTPTKKSGKAAAV